jgi:hypothetical protein
MIQFWPDYRDELANIKELGNKILKQQQAFDDRLISIESMLRDLLLRGKPGPVRLVVTGELFMEQKFLKFALVLPPKAAPDVATRELTVKIGDNEASTLTLSGDETKAEGLKGLADAVVEFSLVDVDGNGNRSPAVSSSARLVDTIAPPVPGELALQVTGEEFIEDGIVAPADEPAAG